MRDIPEERSPGVSRYSSVATLHLSSHIDIGILACHPTVMTLLDQVHSACAIKHYSLRTEASLSRWIERFSDSIESEFGDTSITVISVSPKVGRTDSRKDAEIAEYE